MIRPTSLIRSDSYDGRTFSAPANNVRSDAIDCGITNLPCCCPSKLQRFATASCFVTTLSFLALILGAVEGYFKATVQQVAIIFEYPPQVIDWLLVAHGLFTVLLAFVVAHWGNRIHRVAWLGGISCLQGAACFLVMIPFLTHEFDGKNNTITIHTPATNLCEKPELKVWVEFAEVNFAEDEPCLMTLIILFILQLAIAFGNISYYTHGLTYLDDNVEETRSPMYLSIAIGVRLVSYQSGSALAWIFLQTDWKLWWAGFPILGILLIIMGTMIACFPLQLLSVVMKQTAASILDIATGNSTESIVNAVKSEEPEKNFWPSFKRIITNKLLIMNILASMFMSAAIWNFDSYESRYLEAQFYIPTAQENFQDPWTSRLMKNLSKPPLVMLAVCLAGLIIVIVRPRANRLAAWNVGTSLVTVFLFISYIFIDCKTTTIAGDYRGSLITPFCSRHCDCLRPSISFSPVCVLNDPQTYFSPCHGGCTEVYQLNDLVVYGNCSCGSNPNVEASNTFQMTEGACENSNCALHWKLFQTLSVLVAAILSSGFVGNLLISLRSVRPMDKALALGLEMFAVAAGAFVPAKFAYKSISDRTCLYWNADGYTCNLHNSDFADHISALTASLLFVSMIFDYLVVRWSEDLELYGEDTLSTYFASSPPENTSISPQVQIPTRTASPEEQPLNARESSSQQPNVAGRSSQQPNVAGRSSPNARLFRTTQI